MLRRRLGTQDYDKVAPVRKPLTAEEAKWLALIRARVPFWEPELSALAMPFAPVREPQRVAIVVGNRGASDAFTHDPVTIGFDASALLAAYGPATLAENADRMDRLFRHEYVHLLQKAWLSDHPYEMQSPLRAALAEIWAEGMGNYYSLSARWRSTNGAHSSVAKDALATLEPRLAARLAALACATPERARALTADLSSGPFEKKWGAVAVALWLDTELHSSSDALRAFVQAGPDGVWELADRHLQPALRSVMKEARLAGAMCKPVTPS